MLYSKFFSPIHEDQPFASELFEIKLAVSSFIDSNQIDEGDASKLNFNIGKISESSNDDAIQKAIELLSGGKAHALHLGEALANIFEYSIEFLRRSLSDEMNRADADISTSAKICAQV